MSCERAKRCQKVLVAELASLASDKDDKLGQHREIELKDAMAHLGITDFRFLGAPNKKWRDSGMMGMPQNDRADVFWQSEQSAPRGTEPPRNARTGKQRLGCSQRYVSS